MASSARRRVLIVADAYPGKASPEDNAFIHAQAAALGRWGHAVQVFCPTPFVPAFLRGDPRLGRFALAPPRERWDDIDVVRPRFFRPPGSWFRSLAGPMIAGSVARSFGRAVARFTPDLVHAHMATPVGYAAMLWARRHALPFVLTVHGLDITDYPRRHSRLRRQTLDAMAGARVLIAVSRYLARAASDLGASRPAEVHYIGVDTDRFAPASEQRAMIRARLRIPPDAPVMVHAGRLVPEKGVRDTLAVLARLAPADGGIVLVLIGAGPERKPLERLVARENLAAHIRFLDPMPHHEMPAYLNAADLAIFPTRREGFGQILIEAQACGVPVVASRVGGVPEAVEDGVTGLLVRPGDIDGFVNAASALLYSPDRRAALAQAARRRACDRFTLMDCAHSLNDVYDRCLQP